MNTVVWGLWGLAVIIVVASTRNPLYLGLTGSATALVYVSLEKRTDTNWAWTAVLKIGLFVAALSIAFNLLTVHVGDRVFYRLPESLPIIGGPLTLNALLYGASSAIALMTLLLVAATINEAIDRSSLLRLVPASLAPVGVAAVIGLSFFPQTLAALQQVREAQLARGFEIRRARDVRAILIPVLHLGLERAIDLAEAMETRAFGAQVLERSRSRWFVGAGLVSLASSLWLMLTDARLPALGLGTVGLGLLALALTLKQRTPRGRYRVLHWGRSDAVVAAAAAASIMLVLLTIVADRSALVWSPYPRLAWPGFTLVPGIVCALVCAPALVTSRRSGP